MPSSPDRGWWRWFRLARPQAQCRACVRKEAEIAYWRRIAEANRQALDRAQAALAAARASTPAVGGSDDGQ